MLYNSFQVALSDQIIMISTAFCNFIILKIFRAIKASNCFPCSHIWKQTVFFACTRISMRFSRSICFEFTFCS